MNLTYIIGNGLDLGLGLNTSYNQFIGYYLGKGDYGIEAVKVLQHEIEKDRNTWSSAELAMAKFDHSLFLRLLDNRFEGAFASMMENFTTSLKSYLIECQQRIDPMRAKSVQKQFRCSLISLYTSIPGMSFKNFFGTDRRVDINVFTFNYTNTLDLLIGETPIDGYTTTFPNDTHLQVHIHKTVHVHGVLDADIIFGVDDDSGINATEKYLNIDGLQNDGQKELVRDFLVKKESIPFYNRAEAAEELKRVLENSDWIVLFGLSCGVSDRFWWEYIENLMRRKISTKILYCSFSENNERDLNEYRVNHPESLDTSSFQDRFYVVERGLHRDFDNKCQPCDPLHLTWFRDRIFRQPYL